MYMVAVLCETKCKEITDKDKGHFLCSHQLMDHLKGAKQSVLQKPADMETVVYLHVSKLM